MVVLVRLIGILIVAIGVSVIVKPEIMKGMVDFWIKGNRIYAAGVIRVFFGIILLLAATQARIVAIIIGLGTLFIIGGIIIFTLGPDKVRVILNSWREKSPHIARLMGALALAIGVILLYSA